MKKNIILTGILTSIFSVLLILKSSAIPNPWTYCKDDISCGAKIAGFNFPVRVQNYTVKAMKDMLEITFPYKKCLTVIRKSELAEEIEEINGIKDISGVYDNYPVNKEVKLKNGVVFSIKGRKNKFYTANFSAETGYYSIYCKNGLKIKELENFYKLLEEAEAPRYYEDTPTIERLMDLRRVDDIVEPVYTQDCFPKTLEKQGVTRDCFERANLGYNGNCSLSEIKLIKEYYKKGQDKDPLNNGDGQFCAEE